MIFLYIILCLACFSGSLAIAYYAGWKTTWGDVVFYLFLCCIPMFNVFVLVIMAVDMLNTWGVWSKTAFQRKAKK